MIIECFALPEVGKSTLIENLGKKYNIKSIPYTGVSHWYALSFSLRKPFSVLMFIGILLKEGVGDEGGWKITRFKLSVFINTISRIQFAMRNYDKNDIVIIDEGFIQRLLSLYETKQSASKYVTLLKKIPISDGLIFLEYRGESDRINRGRVGTMRRSINDAYTEKWQQTMLHNYRSLLEALKLTNLIDISYSRDDTKGFDLGLVMKDLESRRIKYCKHGK